MNSICEKQPVSVASGVANSELMTLDESLRCLCDPGLTRVCGEYEENRAHFHLESSVVCVSIRTEQPVSCDSE